MGIVKGNWLTGAHSGRACRHESVYTRVNKKTGACYSAQLCNPNPYRNETQKKVTSAFSIVSAALSAWIATEKEKNPKSDEFISLKKAFDRQTHYSTLRGFMFAKGMYKYENGQVVVDVNANTAFTSVSAAIKLPEGGSSSAPEGGSSNAPAAKYKLLLNASPAAGGSVEGAGEYAAGSSATIKAVANPGYTFTKWSDNDTNAQRTLQMTQDRSLIAYFVSEGSGSGGEGGGEQVGGGVD